MSIKKLDPNNHLFEYLKKNNPAWWENLKKDKQIYIDIRKENYIDVYFNGGAILRELKWIGGKLSAKTHIEYVLFEKIKGSYISYSFANDIIGYSNDLKPKVLNNFSNETISSIKKRIDNYYSASSEKGIQAGFYIKDGAFIDSEFALNNNRVDLVRIDMNYKKIVFVELKTIEDVRLLDKRIYIQLESYYNLIKSHKSQLEEYYRKLFSIKKDLGILPKGLNGLNDIKNFQLLEKPLLIVGNCNQKWIDNNANEINNRIKDVAYGAYYLGSSNINCNLVKKTTRNRYIF